MLRFCFFLFLLLPHNTPADEFKYYIEYLRTSDSHIDLNEIKNSQKWEPLEKTNLGVSKQIFWIKISTHNPTAQKIERVFEFTHPFLDYVTIYFANGKIEQQGQFIPYHNQEKLRINPSFTLTVEPQNDQETFIKIRTRGSMIITLRSYEPVQYLKTLIKNQEVSTILLGISLAMLIYNTMIFIFTKDKSYFYYIMFHFSGFMIQAQNVGYFHKYIYFDFPMYNNYVNAILLFMVNIFSLLFALQFLSLNKFIPKTAIFLRLLIALNIALLFSLPFFISFTLCYLLLMLIKVLLFGIALYMLLIKQTSASKFYALAWSFSLIGILLSIATTFGLLSDYDFLQYGWQIALSIELMLLSISLAYRQNQLKTERDEAKIKVLESEKKLMMQHKMASMGEMINNIAHQWRQPLASLNGIFICLDNKYTNKSLDQTSFDNYLNDAESLTTYMSNTVEDFTQFFSPKKKKEHFSINDVLIKSQTFMDSSLKQHGIELKINIQGELLVHSYPSELMQVLFTLINNARDALIASEKQGKQIRIEARQQEQSVCIKVMDNAGGIDEAILDKVFEPYFTTKHKSQGTGLGLYIAKMVIEKSMNGSLTVFNNQSGAVFITELLITEKDKG